MHFGAGFVGKTYLFLGISNSLNYVFVRSFSSGHEDSKHEHAAVQRQIAGQKWGATPLRNVLAPILSRSVAFPWRFFGRGILFSVSKSNLVRQDF